jgi:hypothetical protein
MHYEWFKACHIQGIRLLRERENKSYTLKELIVVSLLPHQMYAPHNTTKTACAQRKQSLLHQLKPRLSELAHIHL